MFCGNCGAQIKDGSEYCTRCGEVAKKPANATFGEEHHGYVPFFKAVKMWRTNSLRLSGRCSRSEFWWGFLGMLLIVTIIANIHTFALPYVAFVPYIGAGLYALLGFVLELISVLMFIPTLTMMVRRLHDIGAPGWLVLLFFVPVLGWIALLVLCLLPTQKRDNDWGAGPR